jgi:hypothetical protein
LPGANLEDVPYVTYGSPDTDGLFFEYISIVASPDVGGGYKNVTDDNESRVNTSSLEAYPVGHNVENFSKIKIPPSEGDMHSHCGFKAQAALQHLYHRREGGIRNTTLGGAVAATANIIFTGVPTDENYLQLRNGKDLNGDLKGTLFEFKFDIHSSYSSSEIQYDTEGRIIVPLAGVGDGASNSSKALVRKRFYDTINQCQDFLRITPDPDKDAGQSTFVVAGTPTADQTAQVIALKGDGSFDTKTYVAKSSHSAGTFSGLEFSNQGTNIQIATALKACIVFNQGLYLSLTQEAESTSVLVVQKNGGLDSNTTVTTNLSNVSFPSFTLGLENVRLTQADLGDLGNNAIILKDSSDSVTTDSALSITGFVDGMDVPDYGYLTSPFPDITEEGSIITYPNADTQGKGEVWYTRDPYFTFPSGFYRTISDPNYGQPYYQQVRAEDKYSVLDHRTLPVMIYLDGTDSKWKAKYCPWKPRLSGTAINNPGPEAFGTENKRGEKIAAVEFWKGRMWLATDTHLFSSATGDYFNLFLEDITNITDSDPIDLTVNTGQFNLVQSLTSFQNFLFITTQSGNQFEVRGSASAGGLVSPSTIELRSTSFYSSASTANPVKMGSNIFFFDTEKLFLYSGTDAFGNEYSSAYDLSEHIRGYLPEKYQCTTPIPSESTIVMVDEDYKNNMYFYTQKVNSGKLVQSAFYRWILDPADSIEYVQGFESNMYLLVKRSRGPATGLYVYYASFKPVTLATPMLDRLMKITTDNINYDPATNTTSVLVPYYDPNISEVVTTEDWNIEGGSQKAYSRYKITGITNVIHDAHYLTKLTLPGNLDSQWTGPTSGLQQRTLWVGRPYNMDLTLSTQHLRDQNGSAREGVLNLKRLTTRHKNTAQYDIKVTRYNRKTSSVRSEAFSLNDTTDLLGGIRIESEGELFSKILGNAESTTIQITSDYPTPCNVTSLEFIGTHKHGNTSIQK